MPSWVLYHSASYIWPFHQLEKIWTSAKTSSCPVFRSGTRLTQFIMSIDRIQPATKHSFERGSKFNPFLGYVIPIGIWFFKLLPYSSSEKTRAQKKPKMTEKHPFDWLIDWYQGLQVIWIWVNTLTPWFSLYVDVKVLVQDQLLGIWFGGDKSLIWRAWNLLQNPIIDQLPCTSPHKSNKVNWRRGQSIIIIRICDKTEGNCRKSQENHLEDVCCTEGRPKRQYLQNLGTIGSE